ncbi:MAG TPA: hypothetical protein VEN79_13685, partial [Terriglobia bacterium]|nr:hypothetical protein [Terriglobia bacterium]
MVSFLLHNLWALTVLAFEAALAGLAIRHGFFRRLPVFTTYLFSLFVVEATRSVTVMETGITSKAYFWTYWLTQALLLTLRGMVVAEI